MRKNKLTAAAAGVVPCGGRKKSPRTSSIVPIIFYFSPLRSEDIYSELSEMFNWFKLLFNIMVV